MAFGLATVVTGIAYGAVLGERGIFMTAAGVLVGSAWFAFGKYGGLPLVDTAADWHPPTTPGVVDGMHRRGLLVMRRRRWVMWAAVPVALAGPVLPMPALMRAGQPELLVLLVGVPLGIINARYLLSRCPRCGYGFFRTAQPCFGRGGLVRTAASR
jgi:hypothetical protein